MQLGPEALASTVSASPSLLLRSPAELELACARVTRLLSRSTHWHAGLRALRTKPAALAHTLSFDSSRCVLLHQGVCVRACVCLLSGLPHAMVRTSGPRWTIIRIA